jgi:hypothetical protein
MTYPRWSNRRTTVAMLGHLEVALQVGVRRRELLARLRERFVCVPHCTELSRAKR